MYTRRVVVAMAAGSVAGALALQSLYGVLCFVLANLLFSAVQWVLLPRNVRAFADQTWGVFTDNAASGLLTFVLFWTMAFNLVHIF
jgi:ER membrane protein complex subunit 6